MEVLADQKFNTLNQLYLLLQKVHGFQKKENQNAIENFQPKLFRGLMTKG